MHRLEWLLIGIIITLTIAAAGVAAMAIELVKSDPPTKALATQSLPASQPRIVTLRAVGDIMLSRHVGTKMRQANDWTLPFGPLAALLSAADISLGNLESPFFDQGSPVTAGTVFKAEPAAIAGLELAGVDVVNLANNHIMNQGLPGLEYTLSWLAQHGIATIGAGETWTAAHTPAVVTIGDTRVAFLGYSYESFH
ncbi:MAG: CapA family protein, partial [Patescibacteria group bacterium]